MGRWVKKIVGEYRLFNDLSEASREEINFKYPAGVVSEGFKVTELAWAEVCADGGLMKTRFPWVPGDCIKRANEQLSNPARVAGVHTHAFNGYLRNTKLERLEKAVSATVEISVEEPEKLEKPTFEPDPGELEALIAETAVRFEDAEEALAGSHRKLHMKLQSTYRLVTKLRSEPEAFLHLMREKGVKHAKLPKIYLNVLQAFSPPATRPTPNFKADASKWQRALTQAEKLRWPADEFVDRIETKETINDREVSGVAKLIALARAEKPAKSLNAVQARRELDTFADGVDTMGTVSSPTLAHQNDFVLMVARRAGPEEFEIVDVLTDDAIKIWKAVERR